jgi:ubiquinone biosynthesis monooxygenase Coq7
MTHDEYLAQILRVNHAGEFGAKQIYAGQLAVLGNSEIGDTLRHMAEQEEVHLEYFANELARRRIRPTAMHPIWRVLGYALGAGTALLGKEAAMACTVAVEEVIDAHYEKQLHKLPANENELKKKIKKFQAEELEHRDIGLEHNAELAPAYRLLYRAISTGCKAAIWLSKRV